MTKTTKNVLLVALLAVPMVGLFQAPAMACSCSKRAVDEKLTLADATFVGKLTDRKVEATSGLAVSTFRVERVIKGALPETVKVRSMNDGAACGLEAERGKRIGLYLRREGGHFNSNLCLQEDADELIAEAGRGRAPVDISKESKPWLPVAGATLLAAVALLVANTLKSKGRAFLD